MKKSLKLVALLFAMLTLTFSLAACNEGGGIPSLTDKDKYLLITAEAGVSGDLLSYMQAKEDAGEFTFTEMAGMITEINGTKNASDWSWCWMLYTTDSEFSSKEYGQVSLNKTVYASAALGAESLTLKAGEKYLWVYTAF